MSKGTREREREGGRERGREGGREGRGREGGRERGRERGREGGESGSLTEGGGYLNASICIQGLLLYSLSESGANPISSYIDK